jgi:hypothetical protein
MTTKNRTWEKWKVERTPDDNRVYRFRTYANVLGTDMWVEWSEQQCLCGMGFYASQYWPIGPCYWDGYRRYMTSDIEWSESIDGDSKEVIFHGLNLLPCPFTGKPPKVLHFTRRAPYQLEWIGIESHMVKSTCWGNVKEMCEAWNMRS